MLLKLKIFVTLGARYRHAVLGSAEEGVARGRLRRKYIYIDGNFELVAVQNVYLKQTTTYFKLLSIQNKS